MCCTSSGSCQLGNFDLVPALIRPSIYLWAYFVATHTFFAQFILLQPEQIEGYSNWSPILKNLVVSMVGVKEIFKFLELTLEAHRNTMKCIS